MSVGVCWNRMSVFGGDSWAREAQYKKRRVDDLLVEGLHGSSFKKLASGKYTCLVCPNNPVLDSPLTLSECRERELKFTAAGWKRDDYGKWYRDENVEFDSDEEDPNVCLG